MERKLAAAGGIPQPDEAIETRVGEQIARMAEGQTEYKVSRPIKDCLSLAAHGIPGIDFVVHASRREALPIGAPGSAGHPGWAIQRQDKPARFDFADFH